MTRPSLARYTIDMKKIYNIYDAKTHFSELLQRVEEGGQVVIARNGKPMFDVVLHRPKNKVRFGTMTGKIKLTDEDLVGADPDIQEMFYGKDWDKQ